MAAPYGDTSQGFWRQPRLHEISPRVLELFQEGYRKQREAKGTAEKCTAGTNFSYGKGKDTGCIQKNPPKIMFFYYAGGSFKAAI